MMMGKTSIRIFKTAMAALVAAMTIVIATDCAAADNELVIVASGGSFEQALRKNFYDEFTKETGIKIRTVAASYAEQWAKAQAMAQAGKTDWDIVTVGIGEDVSHADLLSPMPCDQLTNLQANAIPGACKGSTLLRTIGGTVLAYSTDAFPKGHTPRNWQDFWDTKDFPGPRMMPNYGAPYVPMALALLSNGVPLDQIRGKPLDVDHAFRRLDQIKPNVSIWWKTGDQSQQAFRNGDVVMGMIWSGRVLALKQSGVPVDFVWNDASAELSAWGLLANAPHKPAAIQFLNFFLTRPDAHLAFARDVGWDTVNKTALQKNYGTVDAFMSRLNSFVLYDNTWLAKQRDNLASRWNEWISR